MKQKGFTLIELVVVIIILGILAVTALPKFVNLQGEARASTLQGMKAALEGAATLTYSKAAIQGKDTVTPECVLISGVATADCSGANEVKVAFGYPNAAVADLEKVLEVDFGGDAGDPNDWWADDTTASTVVIRPKGVADTAACSVTYNESTGSGVRPVITVVSTGC